MKRDNSVGLEGRAKRIKSYTPSRSGGLGLPLAVMGTVLAMAPLALSTGCDEVLGVRYPHFRPITTEERGMMPITYSCDPFGEYMGKVADVDGDGDADVVFQTFTQGAPSRACAVAQDMVDNTVLVGFGVDRGGVGTTPRLTKKGQRILTEKLQAQLDFNKGYTRRMQEAQCEPLTIFSQPPRPDQTIEEGLQTRIDIPETGDGIVFDFDDDGDADIVYRFGMSNNPRAFLVAPDMANYPGINRYGVDEHGLGSTPRMTPQEQSALTKMLKAQEEYLPDKKRNINHWFKMEGAGVERLLPANAKP